jgi:hypothetical protein
MKLIDLFEMSTQDLRDTQRALEWLFDDLKLDVVISTHFQSRVLDNREQAVTKEEVINAFSKLKRKYGSLLVQAQHNHEHFVAVLKDMSTQLNIPFAIHFDHDNVPTYKMHLITIMRKNPGNFKANNAGGQDLAVEGVNNIDNAEVPDSSVGLPTPKKYKRGSKNAPTTDKAENSIIKTLWFYNASDAS